MPSQVQLMSISFSLTEFYHIYTSIHNKQILIPPQFEKVFHCSIHTSKIFLGTVAIQHAKLGTVVHNNIIITHSDSGIWNIKILAKFQFASRRIYLHGILFVFAVIFKYQTNVVFIIKSTDNLLLNLDCFQFFRNLAPGIYGKSIIPKCNCIAAKILNLRNHNSIICVSATIRSSSFCPTSPKL